MAVPFSPPSSAQQDQIENKTSAYNSALSQIFRIDNILIQCNRYSQQNNLIAWNNALDTFYRELAEDIEEGSQHEKKYEEFDSKLVDAGFHELAGFNNGFKQVTTAQLAKIGRVRKVLRDKEIFLRRVMNQQGKGAAYKDVSEEEFE